MSANNAAYSKNRLPFTLTIVPRERIPRWLPAAISAGAIALALVIGGIILALVGGNPIAAYRQIARSSFGSLDVFSDTTPAWIVITLMLIAGMLAGALWGFIPGMLKARFNVNEIISTLMLNYIAIAWNDFFIFGVWSESGF